MDADLMCCPACGSTYFLYMLADQRFVFHVTSQGQPIIIDIPEGLQEHQIELKAIHCGACSWQGGDSQLVAGH